jgi:hypothetical protein
MTYAAYLPRDLQQICKVEVHGNIVAVQTMVFLSVVAKSSAASMPLKLGVMIKSFRSLLSSPSGRTPDRNSDCPSPTGYLEFHTFRLMIMFESSRRPSHHERQIQANLGPSDDLLHQLSDAFVA